MIIQQINEKSSDSLLYDAERIMHSPPGPRVVINHQTYDYFAGTGYLGLQYHPEVKQAACDAVMRYGIGSATSREPLGTTPPILDVERLASQWLGTDASFFFASGYMAARVLLEVIADEYDVLWLDDGAHYSLHEAATVSGLPRHRFGHRDSDDLRIQLAEKLQPGQRPLVMTDGVFSVTGRIAPLADYHDALLPYFGGLLVDDAHGLGVLGERGRGTLEHERLDNCTRPAVRTTCANSEVALHRIATLSKAVGGYGGIIPCSRQIFQRFRERSPLFNGASPVPTPIAAATACAIRLIMTRPELRDDLHRNVKLLRTRLQQMGLDVEMTPVPIIGLQIGSGQNMRQIQQELQQRGFMIGYIPKYSGLGPDGLLRIALFADHQSEAVERLADQLQRLL